MYTEEELEQEETGGSYLYCQTCDNTVSYNLAVYEEGPDGVYSTTCPNCRNNLELHGEN